MHETPTATEQRSRRKPCQRCGASRDADEPTSQLRVWIDGHSLRVCPDCRDEHGHEAPGRPRKPCQLCHAPRDEAPDPLRVHYHGFNVPVCAACRDQLEETRDRRRATPAPDIESKEDAIKHLRRARHGVPTTLRGLSA